MRHKPGCAHSNGDALTRMSNETEGGSSNVVLALSERSSLPSTIDLLKSQEEDPVFGQLIEFLKHPEGQEATP